MSKLVGLVGWRGMVGSVLMDRMIEEKDFDLIEPLFFSTSNAGGKAPVQAKNETTLQDAFNIDALKRCDIIITAQGGDYTTEVYGKLRESGWTRAAGEDFIALAFEYAHAADPSAQLIYNDYNNELDGKREKMLGLLARLKARNTPIHAVGLQGHYEIDRVPYEALEKTLIALRGIGMKVVVSELDIDVIPRGRWWADGNKHRAEMATINPYVDGCPPEILARQAEQYARSRKSGLWADPNAQAPWGYRRAK